MKLNEGDYVIEVCSDDINIENKDIVYEITIMIKSDKKCFKKHSQILEDE